MAKSLFLKRNVSRDDVVRILKEKGIEISEKEAAIVLDFLYKMAILEVKQQLKK